MPLTREDIVAQFSARFGQSPEWIVRAPGRVNLIGEHTDYNDGFVLPLAIERAIWIALRPRQDRRVAVHSADFDTREEFSLDGMSKNSGWVEYLKGIAWALAEAGHRLTGWEGVVQGDVPVGAGLSSSAALEVATARAFAAVSHLEWDPATMARLGQRAENRWIGVNCGIMDQLASAAGQDGHALLIDCRSLDIRPAPLPAGVAVVILDTGTRRGLVDSAYNERRSQCEAAAEFFHVKALRDVTPELYEQRAADLPETTRRRARHVITENLRVERAVDAMQRGDAAALGKLMNESHASLQEDYEVSSDALNAMVDAARQHPACFGARMTGAGFGGCAVAIIKAEASDDFASRVAADYRQATGHSPAVYVTGATPGAEAVRM